MITILCVLVCIFLLVVGVIIRPTIVNTEYTVKVDSTITGSDKEILSQEFEKYKDDLKRNYTENIEQLNNKFNMLLALVGIAVTVWVGLNIYNLVDRAQIDILAKKQKEIAENIGKSQESITVLADAIDKVNKEKQELQQMIKEINESIKTLGAQTAAIQKRNNDFDSAMRNIGRF